MYILVYSYEKIRPEEQLKKKFVNRKLTASVFSDHNNSACFKTAELLYSIGAGPAGTLSAVFKPNQLPVDGKISPSPAGKSQH